MNTRKVLKQLKNSDVAHSLRYVRGITASAIQRFPSKKLYLIGVTGTDGKTTTCNLLYYILKNAGIKVGMISTISVRIYDGKTEHEYENGLHVTSPDSFKVQNYLRKMIEFGCTHAILEATSHALVQNRFAGINFNIGVVTNITHEHLDYHKTFDKYVEAKALLFRQDKSFGLGLAEKQVAIINQDDKAWELLKPYTEDCKRVGYGFSDFTQFHIQNFEQAEDGVKFLLEREDENGEIVEAYQVIAPLYGDYNAQNIVASITAAYYAKVPLLKSIEIIKDFPQLAGRFEKYKTNSHGLIVIDFAHTPHALEEVLSLAKKLATGRIIVVFGSAGLRDIEKRYLMGRVAARLADITIVTAEDPRTENIDDINKLIVRGLVEEGSEEYQQEDFIALVNEEGNSTTLNEHLPVFTIIEDRKSAIENAIKLSQIGDIVLVCGKGHEKSMCFGETEYPWNEQEIVKSAIQNLEK